MAVAAKKPTGLTKAQSDALLIEIKERFDYALRRWQDVRDEGDTDMKYVAGDPWSATDRSDRQQAGRPCVTSDELGQYLNQVVNEVRANPRAVKFSPTGDGANDKTARFYADKMREIEYRSHAQNAYTTAFENAVQRSFGWIQLTMAYVGNTWNKELSIEAVANPNTILPDPDAQRPDSGDMKYLFQFETPLIEEFKRDYPWAEMQNFGPEVIRDSSGWVNESKLRLAVYWKVTTTPRMLCLYQGPDGNPHVCFKDEPKPGRGYTFKAEREVDNPKVVQYLTNGVEILKVTPWKGKAIPFVSCYGKILWVDDGSGAERKVLSMTRLARDPYMAYCWSLTNQVETLGMITKNPYWAYKGQLDPDDLNEIKKSLHEPVAVLQANAYLNGETSGTPMPLPQRNPMAADLQGYSVTAEQFRRCIQAAMGMSPLPTTAQKRNEKSGVALKQIEESGQRGSYHFMDHYNDMIRRCGELVEDLMDKAIDSSREVSIVKPDGTSANVKVITAGSADDTGGEDEFSVKGNHAVTISVGPEMESERQQASDFADTMIGSPQALQIMGPESAKEVLGLVVKLKNLGPIGDQIAEKISPPKQDGPDGKPIPPQIAQRLQLADQVIAKAKEEMAEKDAIINEKRIESETEIRKAMIDADTKLKIAQLNAGSKAQTTDTQAKAKIMDTQMQGEVDLQIMRMESRLKALELGAKARENALDRSHEAALASANATHAVEQNERMHEQGLESGDVSHQQALETQDRAAEQASDDGA